MIHITVRCYAPRFFWADNLPATWVAATAGALLLVVNIVAWPTHVELNPLFATLPLVVRPWVVGAAFTTVLALFVAMARATDSDLPLLGLAGWWEFLLVHDMLAALA